MSSTPTEHQHKQQLIRGQLEGRPVRLAQPPVRRGPGVAHSLIRGENTDVVHTLLGKLLG